MDARVTRKQTLYTRDILPARVVRNINNEVDVDQMVKQQLERVKNLEEELQKDRSVLVTQIERLYENENHQVFAHLGATFLQELLQEIENDEKVLRNKVLGKQEAVEMFKGAVKDKEVPETYLDAARTDRDETSVGLFEIVSMRETVFSALEILTRTPIPPQDQAPNQGLMAMKEQYEFLQVTFKEEHSRLKQFTEWQRNPALIQGAG